MIHLSRRNALPARGRLYASDMAPLQPQFHQCGDFDGYEHGGMCKNGERFGDLQAAYW